MFPPPAFRTACLITGMAFLLNACTKTETIPFPQASKSRIINFRIANSATPISGIVDENDHTITVYLPPTSYLSIIQPEITVSEGASVNLVNDGYIEDLPEYFVKGRNIQYTVTGSDKSTTTYSLKIISQQPPLLLQEITTDVAHPATFNHSLSWYTNDIILYTAVPYYFSASATVSSAIGRVTLVAENGTEYPFNTSSSKSPAYGGAQLAVASYINISLGGVVGYDLLNPGSNKTSPPAGLYWIKVQYYSQVAQLKNPIKIVYE